MGLIDLQIGTNSGVFVYLMVRYAKEMGCRDGWRYFALFIATIFIVNALFLQRLGWGMALYKAALIAAGYVAGVLVLAHFDRRKRAR